MKTYLNKFNTFTRNKKNTFKYQFQLKKQHSFLHTIQSNTNNVSNSEKVLLYEAPEWEEIFEQLNKKKYFDLIPKNDSQIQTMSEIWQDCVYSSSFKPKYFSLIPFLLEDRNSSNSRKKFIMRFQLLPERKQFLFTAMMLNGFYTFVEPMEDIVPIPAEDYRIRHLILRSRPPMFVDMDMLYSNRKTKNICCFDTEGTWVEEVFS